MTPVLADFIASHGYQITDELILDDHWQNCRCERTGEKLRYVGRYNAAGKLIFSFGSFQNMTVVWTYKEKGSALTKEERETAKAEQLEKWNVSKGIAQQKLNERSWGDRPLTDTYQSRKWPLPTLPLKPEDFTWLEDINYEAMLCLAMRDTKGELWNVQFIQKDGTKRHIGAARTQGLFLEIPGDGNPRTEVYLCEGLATALTVREATGARTLCCFSSGNIKHVLSAIRKEKWVANFVVVCDNDWEKKTNAGSLLKEQLPKKFGGITVIQPSNDALENLLQEGDSDYNDVHLRHGIEAVRTDIGSQLPDYSHTPPTPAGKQLEMDFAKGIAESIEKLNNHDSTTPVTPPSAPEKTVTAISEARHYVQPYVNGVAPMPPKFNDKGKEVMPNEAEVANYVMKYYQGRICRSQESIFIYKDTHWVEITDKEHSEIIVQMMVAHNGAGGQKRYEACKKIFFNMVPQAPRNLFVHNPFIINLKNGAIHILEEKDKWTLTFKPRSADSKLDYCVNTIPIDYDPTEKIRNEEFDAMMLRLLGDNPDKLRNVKQMFGACLAPIFPKLFMLIGPKGSGKSSIILAAIKLLSEDNVGHLQPADMSGFYLESLLGKLVNVVTDIDISRPIVDSTIKQIEDRVPIGINRKFQKIIRAPLPAIHIFGGNEMPPTLERGSKAHSRRWCFVTVNNFKAEETGYSRDFAPKVFEKNPTGVLNFALEGLRDLLSSGGLYFSHKASVEFANAWQENNDALATFINCTKDDDAGGVVWSESGWIARPELWRKFKDWYLDYYGKPCRIPKGKVFDGVKLLGSKTRILTGEVQISNFCTREELSLRNADAGKNQQNVGLGVNKNTPKVQNERIDSML